MTAVAFFPTPLKTELPSIGIVVGVNSGEISIWTREIHKDKKEWIQVYFFPEFLRHSMTVRRIKFKENKESKKGEYHIATCSNDATVRVFKINIVET